MSGVAMFGFGNFGRSMARGLVCADRCCDGDVLIQLEPTRQEPQNNMARSIDRARPGLLGRRGAF
jgi:hypothetical protein